MNINRLYVLMFETFYELTQYADSMRVGTPRWLEVTKARNDLSDYVTELRESGIIGYGYIAKDSGRLILVREDQKHYPHVFPLYGTPPEIVDKDKSTK